MVTQTASGGTPAPLAATVEASPASGRAAAGGAATAPPAAPDYDERAVRMALAAGTANLRLKRVREVLDQCTPEDRRRILAALEGPVAE